MKLFLLVILCVPVIRAQFEDEACISDYLRNKGFETKKIERDQEHEPARCYELVNEERKQNRKLIQEILEENQELHEEIDCIMDIYKFTGLDDILMSESLNTNQGRDNDFTSKTNITQAAFDLSFLCRVVGILMNRKGTDQFIYCWLKEIIDNNLLPEFNEDYLNADPKWNEFTNFNCSPLIMTSKTRFEKELAIIFNDKEHDAKCIKQNIQDENVAEKILKFNIFSKIKLNSTSEERLRDNFIQTSMSFKKNVDGICKIELA